MKKKKIIKKKKKETRCHVSIAELLIRNLTSQVKELFRRPSTTKSNKMFEVAGLLGLPQAQIELSSFLI